MDEQTAKRLMEENKIDDYVIVDGKVEVKRKSDGENETNWPDVDRRS